ncbi:conserved hypothetical protein [Paracholeplasma brassicae]|uniref:DUF4838 domain-containing protein n=1 Tax=Acholeplasma brassicae TaxID=61635 RepID=U4KSL0_9MOLU|nr:DUF4838 domain-containing protein [Paracholeplasma brassicae]CCV65124.1 conserved hypothetical protein [Paracholeplasma brassicae]
MSKVKDFAKSELDRYFHLITGMNHQITLALEGSVNINPLDDYYQINVIGGVGVIKGRNERSLLLGVYRLLEGLGVFFHAPKDERITRRQLEDCDFSFESHFLVKQRIVCIEGAVSIENVQDLIDFLPKKQMNGYFIQFQKPYEFFTRWYEHKNHPWLKEEPLSEEILESFMPLMTKEIEKRGLIYHAVGHGWTTRVLGLDASGWQKADPKSLLSLDTSLIAQVNGKREFFKGIPLNTQLCYSNKKVQDLFVEVVVDYIDKHQEIDVLHLWLADDFNNFCECEACQKELPSFYYVETLNRIDEELTKRNIKTKLMFLLYYELLFPSRNVSTLSTDRFMMMFAPITRTYTSSLKDVASKYQAMPIKTKAFKRNENQFEPELLKNLVYLKAWQEAFKGSTVLFDYHLMWDGFKDLPQRGLSQVLYEDMKVLNQFGIDGFISCQLQRNFFPDGLAFHMMAKGLSNESGNMDAIEAKFYEQRYLSEAYNIKTFFTEISSVLIHQYLRKEVPKLNHDVVREIDRIISFINQMKLSGSVAFEEVTKDFIDYYLGYLKLIKEKALGSSVSQLKDGSNKLINEFIKLEADYQSSFDGFYFVHLVREFVENEW